MADCVSSQSKRKTVQFQGILVWIIIIYFYNIFLTIHVHAFYENGFKHFTWTNSPSIQATCPFKVS